MHITLYENISNVPEELRGFVENHGPGVFEIVGKDFDYHAALTKIGTENQLVYIFYNTGSIQSKESLESFITIALLVIGLVVVLMGWFLAKSVSNRILNPIVKLAHEVQLLSPDDSTTRLQYSATKDEVGTLVNTINRLLKKISEFTTREREFTSHASHELRTPVTVIKGAIEIIKEREENRESRIWQPLSRVERAVSEMEKLIKTFLLLARQGEKPDMNEKCNLSDIIKDVVESNRHILKNKIIKVNLNIPDSFVIQAPASLVSIAVANLVRNAFMYTSEGKVEISLHKDRVVISDNGPGIDTAQEGKGLGLTIVKRLCERMKWEFNITSHANEGTCVELIFNHDLSS
jgi:signal transduction histidine kinase